MTEAFTTQRTMWAPDRPAGTSPAEPAGAAAQPAPGPADAAKASPGEPAADAATASPGDHAGAAAAGAPAGPGAGAVETPQGEPGGAGADAAKGPPAGPADDEFSAAAPPHPGARGTGETSFGDAEAPPAGPRRSAERPPDKATEYLELARRTQADFDNYRKRMARENAAAADRGAARLAKELLPALDHLDLALKAADSPAPPGAGGSHEDIVRGFALVRDELIAALGRVGIEAYSPTGEPFDPSQHEAMAQQPSDDAESGTVIAVYQQGYRINGTVLRPARVVVAA
jgi:molecular chaperone GrpE